MKSIRELLDTLYKTKLDLRELGVLRSEKITGELGEWLVERAYVGKRAKGTTQKGWDIELEENGNKILIQVKTHAKGKKNNTRWTEIRPECLELFDRLVIVVLSDDYYINQWYEVPKQTLRENLVQSGKAWVVQWEKLEVCEWKNLPGASDILGFEKKPD